DSGIARLANAFAPIPVFLAPLELGDKTIVFVFRLGAEVAQPFAGDANHAVGDAENMARVVAFCINQPGVEAGEVGTVEKLNSICWNNGTRRTFSMSWEIKNN